MLRSLKDLENFSLHDKDGEIGKIENFYINAYEWKVRYVVIDLETWQEGRRALLSTVALEKPIESEKAIPVSLTRDMLKSSPEIDVQKPITRQEEINLHNYYEWPFYWEGAGLAAYPLAQMASDVNEKLTAQEDQNDPHLHSFSDLVGYTLQARDGEIGKVDDFIVEDENWNVDYLVVETGGLLDNRKVLVSPSWVKDVQWVESRLLIDLARETIKNSPEYNDSIQMDDDYESKLDDYYKRNRP